MSNINLNFKRCRKQKKDKKNYSKKDQKLDRKWTENGQTDSVAGSVRQSTNHPKFEETGDLD